MNKKAFTLIELLAVISILALIAMVVFPAINSVVKSSREKAYDEQVAIIEKAAKEWALDNVDDLPEAGDSPKSVPVSDLVSGGYIAEDKVVDPRDENKTLDGNVKITYESNQYMYVYED